MSSHISFLHRFSFTLLFFCFTDLNRSCKDEFLLLCCDGVWDVLSSQAAVDFVRQQLGDSGSWAWRIAAGRLKASEILAQMRLDKQEHPFLTSS